MPDAQEKLQHSDNVCIWDNLKTLVIHLTNRCNMRCSYCIRAGTKITMSDFSEKNIEDIKPGDEILGFDEYRNGKNKNRRVFKSIVKKTFHRKSELINLVFDDGSQLGITTNHKILQKRNSSNMTNVAWKKAGEFHINQSVTSIQIPRLPKTWITDEYKNGYLVGVWMGDGSIKKYPDPRWPWLDAIRIRLAVKDNEIIGRTRAYMDEFNIKYNIRKFNISKKLNLHKDAIFSNSHGTFDALNKLISENIDINNTYEYMAGFLSGIYDAEGHFGNDTIRISNKNIVILNEIKRCLNRFDIKYTQEGPNLIGCYTIRILENGELNKLKFILITKPSVTRKGIDNFYNKSITNYKKNKKIVNVALLEYQDVYNLETTSATYIANGIAVHNCFERHGQLEDMPEEMMFKIIDRATDSIYFQGLVEEIKTKKKDRSQKFVSISFFGGEPLLRFDLIKSGVAYTLRNKPPNITASFGITTNGTLLTKENIDFMAANNFSMIFSIDGPEETHNINRVFEGGIGSHTQVIKSIPYLLEKMGNRVTARPSYTDKLVPKLFDVVKYLVDDLKFTTIAAIPVIDSTQFGERIDWESVWGELTEQYWKITEWWYQECIIKGRSIDIKFIRDFGRDFLGRYTPINGNACGTGFGYQAYGPNGFIYPCHRYVNDIDHEKMKICKFDDELISNKAANSLFIRREKFTSELGCKTCILEDICSKGCNVVNLKLTGDRTVVPKEQCWFSMLQFRNGMRLLAKYGKDPRVVQRLGGQLKNITIAGTKDSPTAVSNINKPVNKEIKDDPRS